MSSVKNSPPYPPAKNSMPDRIPAPHADGTPRWVAAVMDCAICNYHWVAVYPEDAPRLECRSCGYMNPRHDELAEDDA